MKHLLYLSILIVLTGCSRCDGPDPKYDLMTRYGGWEARLDEITRNVTTCENQLDNFKKLVLDSVDYHVFPSPYPYWKKIYVYLDKDGIRKASLLSDTSKGHKTEHLYYKNGHLIYANVSSDKMALNPADSTDLEQYFFIEDKLVRALDSNGKRRSLEDDTVLLSGVDLIKESQQLLDLIATKKIKL